MLPLEIKRDEKRKQEYQKLRDNPQLNLELGQKFSSPAEFRGYVRTESIPNGYDLA